MKKPVKVLFCCFGILCIIAILYVALPHYPMQQPSVWPVEHSTVHFSVDDVNDIVLSLHDGNKNSIFEDTLLSLLKQWHDSYGIVAGLYVQGPFIVNSHYTDEIIDNSDWLRWGYHGVGSQRRKTGIGSFLRQVRDSIGTTQILDKTVRVDYYHADLLTCLKYRLYGYKAFYTADDWGYNAENRMTNYYLSTSQNNLLEETDILSDAIHDITFIKTDYRAERITPPLLQAHIQHIAGNTSNKADLLILFTHEIFLKSHSERIDSLFNLLHDAEYHFDFPY